MISSVAQPLLHYQGGKWRMAPWIVRHFPPHTCYVESFGGGASVLLRKEPSKVEVYNDINKEIVNLFTVLREHPEELLQQALLTPYSREELVLSQIPTQNSVERARRTLLRYRMSLDPDRSHQEDAFRFSHVSPKGLAWKRFVDNSLRGIIDRLRYVQIENRSAPWVIKAYDSDSTLHYIDPPYDPATRQTVTYAEEFTSEQAVALFELARDLKGFVSYNSALWDRELSNFARLQREVLDFNSNKRTESLWLSPKTAEALKLRRRTRLYR